MLDINNFIDEFIYIKLCLTKWIKLCFDQEKESILRVEISQHLRQKLGLDPLRYFMPISLAYEKRFES
jgi:hypothetical protein